MTRYMLRCPDCLGVWAVDAEPAPSVTPSPWETRKREQAAVAEAVKAGCPYECGATDQVPELMGAVNGGRVTRNEGAEVPPGCDSSCVFARGPKCDCPCGGANHGGGVLALIPKYSDQGSERARFLHAPKGLGKAKERAAEWRAIRPQLDAALAAVQARAEPVFEAKRRREWVSDEAYDLIRAYDKARKVLRDIDDKRTHQGRMKAAAALLAAASPAQPEPRDASREEQHGRYIDAGPAAWDDKGLSPDY